MSDVSRRIWDQLQTKMWGGMSGQSDDVKRAWVERVLKVQVRGNAVAQAGPDVAALTKRLETMLKIAAAVGSPSDIMDDLKAAQAALSGTEPGLAASLLDEVQPRLAARARGGAAAAEIAKASPSKIGVVAFAKLRLQWEKAQAARDVALDNMRAVCAAMLADPEAEEDPQFEEMQAAAASIDDKMPEFGAVDDAIDDMATTDQAKREEARKKALSAIKQVRNELDAEPALKLLQDMPVGKFDIYDGIASALGALETALAG